MRAHKRAFKPPRLKSQICFIGFPDFVSPNELNSKRKTQETPLIEYFSKKEYNTFSSKKTKKRQNKRKMRDMKHRIPKLLISFFIFALVLIIAVPSTGFAAKAKNEMTVAKTKSSKTVESKKTKNVTAKYKKQVNTILEATQLYYSVRLNYSMKVGQTKKIKLTSLEKQNVAAGRQVLEGQSRITNFAFKELFGANARIASLSFKTYPEVPKELVVRCNSNYVRLAVGDWGETYPVYKLKSVTKTGKKWKAVFKVSTYDGYTDTTKPLGKVVLTLKKNKKSVYGFNITGITLKRNK